MFCTSCGAQIPDGAKFCTVCGAQVEDDFENSQPGYAPEGTPGYAPESTPGYAPDGTPGYAPGYGSDPASADAFGHAPGYAPEYAPDYIPDPAASTTPGGNNVPLIVAAVVGAVVLVALVMKFFVLDGMPASLPGNTQEQPSAPATAGYLGASSEGVDSPANSGWESGDSAGADSSDSGMSSDGTSDSSAGASADVPPAAYPPVFSVASASSSLPGDSVTSYYGPNNLTDGDTKTGWAEGADGDGVGEWFEISASSLQEVRGISILSGYCKSEDLYYKNNRPKDVTVTLSDGSQYSYTLSDECGSYQQLDFGSPRQTKSIRVTIDSVYGGTKWSDTVVSEVEAY